MLNRRIIRGKVLQQIFAYKTCVAANAELSTEKIIETFSPDLNSNEPQDAKKLEGFAKLALLNFDEFLKTNNNKPDSSLPYEVASFTQKIISDYILSNKKDADRILKTMVEDSEDLVEYYLLVMKMLTYLSEKLFEIKKTDALLKNKVISQIDKNPAFVKEMTRRNISWINDHDVVRELLTSIHADTEFKEYQKNQDKEFEEDRKLVMHIVKNIMFKNPHLNEYFENKLLNWQEDKAAVKDMTVETIKEMAQDHDFSIAVISKNWDDDKTFMKDLFIKTIEHEREYETYISPKLKNWDISRLTATDNIIMKMCINEMINFSGIPVKVSINEYIELSKRYSTPKSKTLINGVLDSLSDDLVKNGVIRKSGRGLMDNK